MQEAVLQLEGIAKDFDAVHAVDGISFDVRRGEILGFLGPNGAGKTTTIRMILGILRPDRGTIRSALAANSESLPKERTGYLPEERGLYGDCAVLDTLVYFAELKGLRRTDAVRRAERWLARFDLLDWRRTKLEKLSKGMQQKVQFAAAAVHAPDILVLDEPFSGLDPVNQDLIKAIIRELRDEGASVLLSSHQMNLVEELCDRIFVIHRGRRVLYGRLDEVKAQHGQHVVRLRFEGDAAALEGLAGVEDLLIEGGTASCRLGKGGRPDAFMRSLPASLTVLEISVTRPSLHELFIQTIAGEDNEAR